MAKLINPTRKKISASRSNFSEWLSLFERIDKKERMQLIINTIAESPVISSMAVAVENLEILIEVSTTRQNPSRFDELLRI
jgi:hypothetical protein